MLIRSWKMFCLSSENTIMFAANIGKNGSSTPEKKKKNIRYCIPCRRGFSSTATHNDHMARFHSKGPKQLKCGYNKCKKSFCLERDLEQHEKTHQAKKKFQCESCGSKYSRTFELNAHKIIHDPSLARFPCEKCGRGFLCKSHLKQHEKRVHQGFKCKEPGCNKILGSKYNLLSHVKSKHSKELPFSCEECNQKFPDKHRLKVHQGCSKHIANVKKAETQRMMMMTEENDGLNVGGMLPYRGNSNTIPEMIKTNHPSHFVDTGLGSSMGDTQLDIQ